MAMIENKKLNEMFFKALSYHKNNQIKEAANEYIKIIKLDPKCFKAYNNLGAINEKINKNNVAKELFLNAIKLNPNSTLDTTTKPKNDASTCIRPTDFIS